MVGAGIFTVFAPAARAAGNGLLLALALAALVAFCNATSSAQLAAQYPTSGGTYVYGRERLGAWWGFVAGWGFVIGKTASCAAMALTFAAYAAPPAWQKPVGIVAVLALTAVNYRGITRTAALTRALVTVVLVCLVATVLFLLLSRRAAPAATVFSLSAVTGPGLLQAAALIFFAFAGYARIATLGEEVVAPSRTIPRAILIAFGIVVPLYALVAVALQRSLGDVQLALTTAPLAEAVRTAGGASWWSVVVGVGAAVASLGALLALVAGVGRTMLAMARNADLPRPLAAVHSRYAVPHVAEVVLALVVCALVLATDLRGAIGFSSFGVLTYYAVANASALTQDAAHRRFPRFFAALGVLGCVALALAVPVPSLIAGACMLAVGVVGRAVLMSRRRRSAAG
jgi:APA family basic amino acid/polyamine antiporter